MLRNTASEIEWVMNSPAKRWSSNSRKRLLVEPFPGDLVDGAERLVEQHDRRLQRQRPGQRATHPHPARQRLGVVVLEAGEPDEVDRLLGDAAALLAREAVQLGEQLDVAADGAPRHQRGVLEHVADPLAVDR